MTKRSKEVAISVDKRCAVSGEALMSMPSHLKKTYIGEDNRKKIVCYSCKRELTVTRAGLGGTEGSIPMHKDPRRGVNYE